MAFNWRDFATGALEQANVEIDENQAEAKAFKEQQRAAAARNSSVVQTRKARAQQAAAYGKQAMELMKNVPNATNIVQTAMASGMGSITELYDKLNKAANQPGQGGTLGVDDIEAIISMPNIPTTVYEEFADLSLEEFASRTYGATPTAKVETPEEMGLIGKLFGFDDMNQAKRDLAKEQYGGGMSIAEVNQLAAGSEYNSLIPDATMTFRDLPTYTAVQRDGLATDLTSIISDTLTAKKAMVDAIQDNIELSAEQKVAQIKSLTDEAAKSVIERKIQGFSESGTVDKALEDPITQRMIIDAVGADYLLKLQITHGVKSQEDVDAALAAAEAAAAEAARKAEQEAADAEAAAKIESNTPEALSVKLTEADEADDINTLVDLLDKNVEGEIGNGKIFGFGGPVPLSEEALVERFGPGPVSDAVARLDRIKKMAGGTFVIGEDDTPTEAKIRADIKAGEQETPEKRRAMAEEYGPGPVGDMFDKIRREEEEQGLADEY